MNALVRFLIFFFVLISGVSVGQQKRYDLSDLLTKARLTVVNRHATLGDNEKIVKLDAGSSEGLVWLNGVSFSRGAIEIDLKGKDVLQQSFIGIAFHGATDSTYDAIYFRPFNFRATDPIRKIHAVQYISHPTFGWKKLRDEHNGLYEKGLPSPPDPDGWFHARIVVREKTVTVFVNDEKNPSLRVEKLNDRKEGKIGLWVGDGSDGEFKNLSISTSQ